MKPQELNLQSEVFNDSLFVLDQAIQKTVASMMEKGMKSGAVSLKIGFTVEERVNEETGETYHAIMIEPRIGSKVGSSGSAKVPAKAGIIMRNRGGDLIIAGNQISMDELLGKGA